MKRVLGPVEACMDRYLVAGGLKWKRGQDIAETSACSHAERQSCKKFPVCMAESGEPLGDSIDQLAGSHFLQGFGRRPCARESA